jgi:hypothetical protein
VQVQTNALFQMSGATVDSNVSVGQNAQFYVFSGTGTINGNVRADQCNEVALLSDGGAVFVGGNVQIQSCTSGAGYQWLGYPITIGGNFVCENTSGGCAATGPGSVGGNVQVNGNLSSYYPAAIVSDNTVGGNVQVNDNSGSGPYGSSDVGGNKIQGNLQCQGNTGGVTDNNGANTVGGNKQGQCAGL